MSFKIQKQVLFQRKVLEPFSPCQSLMVFLDVSKPLQKNRFFDEWLAADSNAI